MRFGIWADTIPSRKNVFKAVQSFVEAALPDAELDVKLHSFAGMGDTTMFADKNGRPLANISIHTGAWPRKKLVAWLQSLDCMIYLSGGEGYGLMPLEAAACGLTTICHNSTGMKEYLNKDAFYLVESDGLEKALSYTIGYGYPAMIPKPNYDQAVELIRYAYTHRQETYDRGYLAQQIAQQHSWEQNSDAAWGYIKMYHQYLKTGDNTYLQAFL
jgi:glycosyltransferase involved in cell wall biosynthesis